MARDAAFDGAQFSGNAKFYAAHCNGNVSRALRHRLQPAT